MNKIICLFLIICFFIILTFCSSPEKSLTKCLKKCKKTEDNYQDGINCVKSCSRRYFKTGNKDEKKILSDSYAEPLIAPEKIWEMYRRTLFYFLKRNDPTKEFFGLQMVTEPTEAGRHINPSSLSLFANSVSEWGSIYKITTRTFPSVYKDFLMNLNMAGPSCSVEDKAKYDSLYKDYQSMQNQVDEAMSKCNANYEAIKGDLGASYTYESFQNKWCPNVDTLNSKLKNIFGQMSEYQTKINGEFWDTLQTLQKCAKDTKNEWTDSGELKSFFDKAKKGEADKFQMDSKKIDTVLENRKWIKESSSGFLCFGSSSSESKSEMRFHGENFALSISAEGYAAINISPKGDWFSNAPIARYKDKKNLWLNQNKVFFGESGPLALMKKIVYVIYKPKVTLTMTKEDKYSFDSQKSSGFSFLFFSSKKNSKVTESQNKDNTFNVSFENNSDEVQIIGIDNTINY